MALYSLTISSFHFLPSRLEFARKRQTVSKGSIQNGASAKYKDALSPEPNLAVSIPCCPGISILFDQASTPFRQPSFVPQGIVRTGRVQGDTTRTNHARARTVNWRWIHPRTDLDGIMEKLKVTYGAYQYVRVRLKIHE